MASPRSPAPSPAGRGISPLAPRRSCVQPPSVSSVSSVGIGFRVRHPDDGVVPFMRNYSSEASHDYPTRRPKMRPLSRWRRATQRTGIRNTPPERPQLDRHQRTSHSPRVPLPRLRPRAGVRQSRRRARRGTRPPPRHSAGLGQSRDHNVDAQNRRPHRIRLHHGRERSIA